MAEFESTSIDAIPEHTIKESLGQCYKLFKNLCSKKYVLLVCIESSKSLIYISPPFLPTNMCRSVLLKCTNMCTNGVEGNLSNGLLDSQNSITNMKLHYPLVMQAGIARW